MTIAPLVRVIVVNFDGGDVTLRCLDALLATDHPADRLEIVLVDNASVDGLNWVIRERYPRVRLIQSDVNEGFARGCNLGMNDLDGVDHVALINNDAMVEPDWLRRLLPHLDDLSVGAVVPKLLLNLWARAVLVQPSATAALPDGRTVGVHVDRVIVDGVDRTGDVRFDERWWHEHPDESGRWSKGLASVWWPVDGPASGTGAQRVTLRLRAPVPIDVAIGGPDQERTVVVGPDPVDVSLELTRDLRIVNSAGGELYAGWFGGDRGFMQPDVGQYDTVDEVFSWCGGAVLLRGDYLRQVGLFDSTFFLYYEDFDLSWRGRSVGWRYLYEPSAVVLHEHAYSSKAGSAFFTFWVERNRVLTLLKNAPAGAAMRAVTGIARRSVRDTTSHVYHRVRRLRPPSPIVLRRSIRPLFSVVAATPAALRERRRIDRRRTVPRAELATWTRVK